MQSKIQSKKKFILILYGYPGAGKTTFATAYSDIIDNTVHIDIDKLKTALLDKISPAEAEKTAETLAEYMAEEFLAAGINVVLDVPANKKSQRRKHKVLAHNSKATLATVWIQIDADSAFDRLKKQKTSKTKPAKTYTRNEFEAIINSSHNPLGEDYVVISGKHTFNTQKAAVLKKMQEMGILDYQQLVNKKIKPELVNLIPPRSFRNRDNLKRRDISIR